LLPGTSQANEALAEEGVVRKVEGNRELKRIKGP
jgi:hypothetical protein